jgi:hypothetical protein
MLRMDATGVTGSGAELPPDVAALAELIAEKIGAGAGRWRLEFFLENGRVRNWARREEGGRDDLGRFSEEAE